MKLHNYFLDLNEAVLTTSFVLDKNDHITRVYHYLEDGMWEFGDATEAAESDKLFHYNQPSFKATHGNKVIDFGSPTRTPGTTGRPTPNFYIRYNK